MLLKTLNLSVIGYKILLEKEKVQFSLQTNNTDFAKSRYSRVAHLTHYHTMPHFDTLRYIAVENIVRKGEIACNKQFLLFVQCVPPYMAHFFVSNALENVVYNLFQFGPV